MVSTINVITESFISLFLLSGTCLVCSIKKNQLIFHSKKAWTYMLIAFIIMFSASLLNLWYVLELPSHKIITIISDITYSIGILIALVSLYLLYKFSKMFEKKEKK